MEQLNCFNKKNNSSKIVILPVAFFCMMMFIPQAYAITCNDACKLIGDYEGYGCSKTAISGYKVGSGGNSWCQANYGSDYKYCLCKALNSGSGSCTDTDGGYKLETAGTCTAGGSSHKDSCASTSTITEYSCTSGSCYKYSASCPTGKICSNGACVSSGSDPSNSGTSGFWCLTGNIGYCLKVYTNSNQQKQCVSGYAHYCDTGYTCSATAKTCVKSSSSPTYTCPNVCQMQGFTIYACAKSSELTTKYAQYTAYKYGSGDSSCSSGYSCYCLKTKSSSGTIANKWACTSSSSCQSGYCAPYSQAVTNAYGRVNQVCCSSGQCGVIDVNGQGACHAVGISISRNGQTFTCGSGGVWLVSGSGQTCTYSSECTGGQFCCKNYNSGSGTCCPSGQCYDTGGQIYCHSNGNNPENTNCQLNIGTSKANYCSGDAFDLTIQSTCNGVATDIPASSLGVNVYRADRGTTANIPSNCFVKIGTGNIRFVPLDCPAGGVWGEAAVRTITVSGVTSTGVSVTGTKNLIVYPEGDTANCPVGDNDDDNAGNCPFKDCNLANSGSAGWSCTCGTNALANAANPYCCPGANGGVGGVYSTPALCQASCTESGNGNCQASCPGITASGSGQVTFNCNGVTFTCNGPYSCDGATCTCNDANCQGGGGDTCGTNCVSNPSCQCTANMRTSASAPFCCSTANNGVGMVYATQAECTTACTGDNDPGNPGTVSLTCPSTCVKGTTCPCTISGCTAGIAIASGAPVSNFFIMNDITSAAYTFSVPTSGQLTGIANVVAACWQGATGKATASIQVN